MLDMLTNRPALPDRSLFFDAPRVRENWFCPKFMVGEVRLDSQDLKKSF